MNEKEIVRRMKASAKGSGCKVWRSGLNVLVLCGGGWCFVCRWEDCPPSVLGLIAQWLHGLPAPNSGFWYMGYDKPDPLYTQPPELDELLNRTEGEDLILAKVQVNGLQMAQSSSRSVYWFDAGFTSMLGRLETTGGGVLLPPADPEAMPWGRWSDKDGNALFLEAESRIPRSTTAKLEALDCWEVDRI